MLKEIEWSVKAPYDDCRVKHVPEPLIRGTNEAGEVTLDVLNVVQFPGKGILDVNDDDLPVGLALIQERHNTEDLDLLDLSDIADLLADLTDIKRVVVPLGFRLGVGGRRVLPGLEKT